MSRRAGFGLSALIVAGLILQAEGCAGSHRSQAEEQEAGARASQASLAGCYRIEVWPEGSGPQAEAERPRWNVPEIIRLDADPMTEWPSLAQRLGEVFVARTWLEGRWTEHPFAYWRTAAAGDSVYVAHPAAFAGLTLELATGEEGLEGQVVSFTDVRREAQPSGATAPVRVVPVACPPTSP